MLTLQRGITTPKALRRAFAHAVNDYMTSPKRGSAQASALLAGLTDCQFARCTDRKVTGSINDQVWRAKWILNDGETNFTAICGNLNYTPMGALGMEFPDQLFPALPLT